MKAGGKLAAGVALATLGLRARMTHPNPGPPAPCKPRGNCVRTPDGSRETCEERRGEHLWPPSARG
jgi:hypothetical protein